MASANAMRVSFENLQKKQFLNRESVYFPKKINKSQLKSIFLALYSG